MVRENHADPVPPASLVNLVDLLHPAFHRGLEVLVHLNFLSDLCLPFLLADLAVLVPLVLLLHLVVQLHLFLRPYPVDLGVPLGPEVPSFLSNHEDLVLRCHLVLL